MNFLNRQMFQDGGGAASGAASLGAYQIRDKLTGEILIDLSQQPNFINLAGFNPYKILNDDTLEKGPAVLSILQQFQQRDAPQIGPFQAQEDLGTNLVDLGFSTLRGTEPFIRGGSRLIGETFGIQPLKDFGGKQEFDPSLGFGGIDLFKPTYDSYVPTDQDRSRAMIGYLKQSKNIKDNAMENIASNSNVQTGINTFFDTLKYGDKKVSDYFGIDPMFQDRPDQQIQDFQTDIDGFVGPTQPGVDVVDEAIVTESSRFTPRFESETLSLEGGPFDMETRKLEYQQEMIGRDEFGNLLPEGRLEQDDEISQLLEDIKPAEQKVDVDKTEADTLAQNEAKFGGLSQDEFRDELDKDLLPTMPELPGMPDLQDSSTGETVEEMLTKQNDPVSRKLQQPGFFGSDRFLDFIRNVGGELTRTGDMAQGLGFGAAKAAEERTARELMAGQEERDYQMKLRLAKAQAALDLQTANAENVSGADVVKYVEFEDEVGTALKNFDEDERILSDINQILNEDINAPGAFGAQGFFGKINDKFRNAAGFGETEWENLSAEVRTEKILEITAQRSVRNILGESGKTISNLDREIVSRIFGNVDIWTSPAELKKILGNSRSNIIEGLRSGQNQIISRATALNRVGYSSPVLSVNQSLIQRILNFNFDNIENYRLGEESTGYIETTL